MTDDEARHLSTRGAWTVETPGPPEPQEVPVAIKGADVSNNNGAVDLAAMRAGGVEWVAIKASEGATFKDWLFTENWTNANTAELVRCAYHFARPSLNPPAAEVTLFKEMIDTVGGLRPGDAIALDIEDTDAIGNVSQWCAEWLDLAERVFHVTPFFYSGAWYMSAHGLFNPAFGKYPLWLAHYAPTLPKPPIGWDAVTIWQTGTGTVPGVSGDCDQNIVNCSADDLRALGYQPAPAPSPPSEAAIWEMGVSLPIFQGITAARAMSDAPDDRADCDEISMAMDRLKARHP